MRTLPMDTSLFNPCMTWPTCKPKPNKREHSCGITCRGKGQCPKLSEDIVAIVFLITCLQEGHTAEPNDEHESPWRPNFCLRIVMASHCFLKHHLSNVDVTSCCIPANSQLFWDSTDNEPKIKEDTGVFALGFV